MKTSKRLKATLDGCSKHAQHIEIDYIRSSCPNVPFVVDVRLRLCISTSLLPCFTSLRLSASLSPKVSISRFLILSYRSVSTVFGFMCQEKFALNIFERKVTFEPFSSIFLQLPKRDLKKGDHENKTKNS